VLDDGRTSSRPVTLPHSRRAEHLVLLGKTGTGKSSALLHFSTQDIAADRGFVHFDLHGETTRQLLALLAAEERRRRQDLSDRIILVEPADRLASIGLNVLVAADDNQQQFVRIAEITRILKSRWHLESFGPRTEELLRNALLALSDNGLTLLELAPLLTNAAFRSQCLTQVRNEEVRTYFRDRYDQTSPAMQAAYRDPVLNKVSVFTGDPHFRHIVGQLRSSFSFVEALDRGYWVVLNLEKGRLGEQAATLGSLFLAQITHALFARRRRTLCTVYCDELQNLVAYDAGIEMLFAEARKFGVSICSANQFLDQYPPSMRAAVLSVATHIFFQLSSADADVIAKALEGGQGLRELLKNLPQRHIVVKTGPERWQHAVVPRLAWPVVDTTDLVARCRARWTTPRTVIEQEIGERHRVVAPLPTEALHDWE
jgi:hypothetical protein